MSVKFKSIHFVYSVMPEKLISLALFYKFISPSFSFKIKHIQYIYTLAVKDPWYTVYTVLNNQANYLLDSLLKRYVDISDDRP